jgi:hypothetical protein
MKPNSLPVRFMGKHPVFGKTKRTRSADGQIKNTASGVRFDKSPYYWWWRALRLSEDYELVCKSKGKASQKSLSDLYNDFGNVFESDFEHWWRQRGEILFGEPPAPMSVKIIEFKNIEDYRETVESNQTLLVGIPLFLSKRDIAAALRKLVAKKHSGARGRSSVQDREEKSKAKYKLKHYKGIEPIIRSLEIVEKRRQGVLLKNLAKHPDEELPSISRMERMGKSIIKGVERGQFPLTSPR